ncbi:MAG: SDR family NAD(P)-dependent oxidoreductase [Deltaproteobacteria bacterium]|nr:SDR family NAD(P)-dependent oxidoreductase [Deltaproteobacteria bacterium]
MTNQQWDAFVHFVLPILALTGILVWIGIVLVVIGRVRANIRRRAQLDLAEHWVVVTGCDSGFGRGVVESLVAKNANVIACCFTKEGAEAALGAGARSAPCVDLTDLQALQQLADNVKAQSGAQLWGLVHNAGVVLPGFVDYQPLSFYRRVMEVNFFAPVALTQRLLPSLRAAKGRVVLISSVDGLVSLPGNAPYDASKFAVEAYADALRVELAQSNVDVSVVNPSTMRTPLAMSFFDGHQKAWNEMERIDPDGSWKQHYPAEWLEAYIAANTKNLERIAQDPQHAIDDIVHALSSKHPRLRYLSGTLAKTLFYALWIGPESWSHAFKRASIQPPPPSPSRGANV